MTLSVGDRLPDSTFKTMASGSAKTLTTSELFSGKKVVLFGVPGAFTPTCTNDHLPGYLENYDALVARGVDTVAVVAVNDHHVMNAWAKFTGGEGKLIYLADGNADFVKAAGLEMDMSQGGLGTRSRRFSLIAEDGVVQAINFETQPGKADETGAAKLLDQLQA